MQLWTGLFYVFPQNWFPNMYTASTGHALAQSGAHRNVFGPFAVFLFVNFELEKAVLMLLVEQDMQ